MLPTPVHIGDESFLDRETLSTDEFYQKLEDGAMPSTSQISPGKYEQVFREELEKRQSGFGSLFFRRIKWYFSICRFS